MRNSFDEQLKELNRELIEMGSLCEQIISGAIGALLKNSEEQRRLADSIDGSIDRKERDIEALCMRPPAAPAARCPRPAPYILRS